MSPHISHYTILVSAHVKFIWLFCTGCMIGVLLASLQNLESCSSRHHVCFYIPERHDVCVSAFVLFWDTQCISPPSHSIQTAISQTGHKTHLLLWCLDSVVAQHHWCLCKQLTKILTQPLSWCCDRVHKGFCVVCYEVTLTAGTVWSVVCLHRPFYPWWCLLRPSLQRMKRENTTGETPQREPSKQFSLKYYDNSFYFLGQMIVALYQINNINILKKWAIWLKKHHLNITMYWISQCI